MRRIWEEAEKRDTRPTPNQMLDWLRPQLHGAPAPSQDAIGKMLTRHWRR